MSKSKEEQARREGMSYALRYAKEYGIEALEEDLKKRAAYNIPVGIDKKALEQFSANVKNMTCDTFLVLTLVTLHDLYGFGHTRLQRFQELFDFKASCFEGDFTNWQMQLDILKEECDIEIEIRENSKDVRIKH